MKKRYGLAFVSLLLAFILVLSIPLSIYAESALAEAVGEEQLLTEEAKDELEKNNFREEAEDPAFEKQDAFAEKTEGAPEITSPEGAPEDALDKGTGDPEQGSVMEPGGAREPEGTPDVTAPETEDIPEKIIPETGEIPGEMVREPEETPGAFELEDAPVPADDADEGSSEGAEASVSGATVRGQCGNSARWSLNKETWTLTIDGSGKMQDYGYDNDPPYNTTPWREYCSSIKKVVIGENITHVGNYAFYALTAAAAVTFKGEKVATIGSGSFFSMFALKKISLPKSVTTIQDKAFAYDKALSSVSFPSSLKKVGAEAFNNCGSLKSVELPSGISKLGKLAFGSTGTVYFAGSSSQWKKCGGTGCVKSGTKVIYIASIKGAKVSGVKNMAYNGKARTLSLTVKLKGKTLKKGRDYSVTYSNNKKISAASQPAKVVITGKGRYRGKITKTFKITYPVKKLKISGIKDKTYTGKALKQKITVKRGNAVLTEGTDYKVSYKNNVKVGKASVVITGKGSYTGSVTKKFKISKPASGSVKTISMGWYHSAAIKKDGSLWIWGWNNAGQIGDGTKVNRSKPVKIMDNVKSVSLGGYHSAAIKKDGSLWIWGSNYRGQIGDGSKVDRPKPVKIMDNVVSVSLGGDHSAAIKKDGNLWLWGSNYRGQIGDGSKADRPTPVKIMDNAASVSLGGEHSAVIKEDGSLWLWGGNDYGQIGDGTTAGRLTPVKIMDNAASVSLGGYHSAVIKKNGSLWLWGWNDYGQIGDGTKVDRSKPVRIMYNAANVSLGGYHSAVIKKDGSLWLWGENDYGQIGDRTTANRKKPVNIMKA